MELHVRSEGHIATWPGIQTKTFVIFCRKCRKKAERTVTLNKVKRRQGIKS